MLKKKNHPVYIKYAASLRHVGRHDYQCIWYRSMRVKGL